MNARALVILTALISLWSLPQLAQAAPGLCATSGPTVAVSPSGSTSGKDSSRIQDAIDEMSMAANGGTVVLAPGTYLLALRPLWLKSDVTLCAPKGATIKRRDGSFGDLLKTMGTWNRGADNAAIVNITFDGGPIVLSGSGLRVESSTFQNVNRTASEKANNANNFGRMGIWLIDVRRTQIVRNTFRNLEYGGIFGHSVSDQSAITDNTFEQVYEPIHLFCPQKTEFSRNTASGIGRMGIELQVVFPGNVEKMPPCETLDGISIHHNHLRDWVLTPNKELITGISTERLKDSSVHHNTLTCGAGCNNLDPTVASIGIESSTRGQSMATYNTIRGFHGGIVINDADDLLINRNAIYESTIAIDKAGNEPVSKTLTIDHNLIANARWKGIQGAWQLVNSLTITNNLITRNAGKWASDNAQSGDGSYAAITVGNLSPSSTRTTDIVGNTIAFKGNSTSSQEMRGIMLVGVKPNISIRDNWIGWSGPAQQPLHGLGLTINTNDSSKGVALANNVFQNLLNVSVGWECKYSAGTNTAINMLPNTLGQQCTKPLADPHQLLIPTTVASATPLSTSNGAPASAVFGKKLEAKVPPGYNVKAWFAGDGQKGTGNAATYWYDTDTDRTASVVLTGPHGATSTVDVPVRP